MKKIHFLGLFIIMLISVTTMSSWRMKDVNSITSTKLNPFRTKHIDIIVTATNGCTIHVVGEISYTIIPPRATGFQGTVTLGGPGSCAHTTLTINYAARGGSAEVAGLEFADVEICSLKKVTWFNPDKSISSLLNDKNLNDAFIAEVKKGECETSGPK